MELSESRRDFMTAAEARGDEVLRERLTRIPMTSLALFLLLQAVSPSAPHPFRVEDLQKLRRLNEAVLSPDGRWVAYSIQTSNV